MTLRTQKRLLVVFSGLMVGGIAVAICIAAWPVREPSALGKPSPVHRAAAGRHDTSASADYGVIWARDLRLSLYDQVATPPPAAPPPKLSVKLVGTVVDDQVAYGVFRNGAGEDKIVSAGETIEGAEVLSVEAGAAKVKYCGQVMTLVAPKKEGS